MKRIGRFLLILLISALSVQGYAQVCWIDVPEYTDYMRINFEKDEAIKATKAEKFLADHKNSDPQVLTNIYAMMFLAYSNAGNWTKTLETFDRISLAPKLTTDQKTQFAQIVSMARQRLSQP